MMKYLALVVLLLFVSSCSLMTADMFSGLKSPHENKPIPEKKVVFEETDFGVVTPQDIEDYTNFQIQITCGKSHELLLDEYNLTMDKLVYIGKKVGNETLMDAVFSGVMRQCPEKIDVMEPSIGTLE